MFSSIINDANSNNGYKFSIYYLYKELISDIIGFGPNKHFTANLCFSVTICSFNAIILTRFEPTLFNI